MRVILLAGLFLFTMLSRPALAYLDPGSGSMLVAGIVGLLASLLFFLKGVYYKGRRFVLGLLGKTPKDDLTKHQLVIYSEGRQYWSTFRPVIDELVRRNERCLYLTSDDQDPGLLYSSELVSTKYIGTGTKAFTQLAVLTADICAMTTPCLDVLQIKRSRGVKHYAHLIHAPTDAAIYPKYSFDYYDSIMTSGDHQIKSIRRLEDLRGVNRKLLIKTGCLYYDEMKRRLKELPPATGSNGPITVLIAPTWGLNGLLKRFGARVLIPLLEKQWNIILRPHPQSYGSERGMLDSLREEVRHYSNLQWDDEADSLRSMVRADVLVSDISGTVFDFAFLCEKPVITIKFDLNKAGLEAADLPWDPWELTVLDRIGKQVDEIEVSALPKIIEEELLNNDRKEKIRELRDQCVVNFGCAATHVTNELLRIRDEISGKKDR